MSLDLEGFRNLTGHLPLIGQQGWSSSMLDEQSLAELLRVLGDKAVVLHGLEESDAGGDLDCAVDRMDSFWPLRYSGWRLCQCLRYDITGRTWILENDGACLEVDSLDDPLGIGQYGFSTDLVFHATRSHSMDAIQAAYLVAKRLRKGDRADHSWKVIEKLADSDTDAFEETLKTIVGVGAAKELAREIGHVPGPQAHRKARIAQIARRFRTPKRAALTALASCGRIVERLSRPTGMLVVVVGPDGVGKSTLCEELEDVCRLLFRDQRRFHWRPGLLPRPGALFGKELRDPSLPHQIRPRSRALSPLLLGYYWFDFLIGGWGRIWPLKLRSTLVVVERGWRDVLVDPKRYGFRHVRESFVRAAEWFLPTPDLILVLEGAPEDVALRKGELSVQETERQSLAWRKAMKHEKGAVFLDSTKPGHELVATAHNEIVASLERRALSGLGPGWVGIPSRNGPRWLLPRGPAKTARQGVKLYQPVTQKGRIGWEIAKLSASFGVFQTLRRAPAPSKDILDLVMPFVPRRGNLSVGRCNHPARYVVLVLDEDGQPSCFAKIALQDQGMRALREEAERIQTVRDKLPPPLSVPGVISQKDGILVLEAVRWKPRALPWLLPSEVARALGEFFGADSRLTPPTHGWAHGDFSPWNLLREGGSWVLVDWEEARNDARLFVDVFHYFVQAHSLLGAPSKGAVLRGIEGNGFVGRVVRAYCEGAGVELDQAREQFPAYLKRTQAGLDPEAPDGRRAIRARQKLLSALGS